MELYPILGNCRLSRPACGEDIRQGCKVHDILELQQREVVICSPAVVVGMIPYSIMSNL